MLDPVRRLLLDDIPNVVPEAPSSREGVNERPSLDRLQSPGHPFVQEVVADSGVNDIRQFVKVLSPQVLNDMLLGRPDHLLPELLDRPVKSSLAGLMNGRVGLVHDISTTAIRVG